MIRSSVSFTQVQKSILTESEQAYIDAKEAFDENMSEDTAQNWNAAERALRATGSSVDSVNEKLSLSEQIIAEIVKLITQTNPLIQGIEDEIDDMAHTDAIGGYYSQDDYDADWENRVGKNSQKYAELLADGSAEAEEKRKQIDEESHSRAMARNQRHYDDEKRQIDEQYADKILTAEQYQAALRSLNDKYYKNGTLGSNEDGQKQYEANIREIEAMGKTIFDDNIKELDRALANGEITVAQYWTSYYDNAQNSLAGVAQLTDDYNAAMDNYNTSGLKAMYDDDLKHLQRNYDDGLITTQDYLAQCEDLWRNYFKDKKQFADEDYETQKELLEKTKDGIQEQIDALEDEKKARTAVLNAEVDALNEKKDDGDKIYDDQIDALEEQLKLLNKQKEQEEKIKELEEKRLAIEEAMRDLQKSYRVVYTGGGQMKVREDADARKKLEEAKKAAEVDNTKAIQDQIDALNEAKEKFDKGIDKEVQSREKAIANIERPLDNLINVLTLMLAENHNYDPKFIESLLTDSDAGKAAMDEYNKQLAAKNAIYKKKGNEEVTPEVAAKTAEGIENKPTKDYKYFGGNVEDNSTATEDNTAAVDKNTTAIEEAAESTDFSKYTTEQLVDMYNQFIKDQESRSADYGVEGHEGNVDFNHRGIQLNDEDYETIHGATLLYKDFAKAMEQELQTRESQGEVVSESLRELNDTLWKLAGENGEGAFNFTALTPDGSYYVADNDDAIFDYILNQLMHGVGIDKLKGYMGGKFATVDEAGANAQLMHENNARDYERGYYILAELLERGFDVNTLENVVYNGVKAGTLEGITDEFVSSGVQTGMKKCGFDANNFKSAKFSKDDKTTEATKEATEELTDFEKELNAKVEEIKKAALNGKTVADPTISIGGQNYKVNADGTISVGGKQIAISDSDKNRTDKGLVKDVAGVLNKDGHKVKLVTKSEWEKKHTVGEWMNDGQRKRMPDIAEMTMETYNKLYKPLKDVDPDSLTNKDTAQLVKAITQPNPNMSAYQAGYVNTTSQTAASEVVPNNIQSAIQITCPITIEGNADAKTIDAFRSEMTNFGKTLLNELTGAVAQIYSTI